MDIRFHSEVSIPLGKITVEGELTIPLKTDSIVIFSHGSGSSRFSKRNQEVAKYLQQKNMGTLLFDLLTREEDQYYHNRFDIDLLTRRLTGATEWLEKFPAAKDCSIGYFGASTGAASALKAAAYLPSVKAVVSRGGRPDLAMDVLHKVEAPTLLIVGSLDYDVLKLNQQAYAELKCPKQLEIVGGATHLFEEQGKMEIVAALAAGWFEKYLKQVNVHS
ncbi:MAG: alpha/beta hydrolase [Bacteroidota bacterium]|nr:alpha/beta hydrolase [Bacteroidota bacterium]